MEGININHVVKGTVHTAYGPLSLYTFSITDYLLPVPETTEHLALVKNDDDNWDEPVFARINSACITSEVFNCTRCDCKWQLDRAVEIICSTGKGIITYHSTQEGRGFGLAAKMHSYNLMDQGFDTAQSYLKLGMGGKDSRNYRSAIAIFKYFNILQIKLLSNNKRKFEAIKNSGIQVLSRHSLIYSGEEKQILKYLLDKSLEPEQDLLREDVQLEAQGSHL